MEGLLEQEEAVEDIDLIRMLTPNYFKMTLTTYGKLVHHQKVKKHLNRIVKEGVQRS